MKKIFLLFAFMGIILFINAQEYYIEGFYERHGEGKYTLTDVHTQGITIDGKTDFPNKVFSGAKSKIRCNDLEATLIKFSFEKVSTQCQSWRGLRFQYWDDDNYKWKDDVEACKGESKGYTKKDMVMMLVLDYSSSMSQNTYRMKTMSIDFINAISKMSSGNVHIGIIAFAGMDKAKSQVFPITPLNEGNSYKFEEFIRNSTMGTETALYYSMDNAMKMIEKYVAEKGFDSLNFNGTCMITFTDGLDNASINDDISLTMHRGSKNEYLAYLSEKLKGSSRKMILGMPLENFAIGFSGSENFSAEDLNLFENVLQRTTPDREHFTLASKFEDVEKYFKDITRKLTERWQTLNVYIGEAQHGRVRWVLECGETPKPLKESSGRQPSDKKWFFGFNFGAGVLTHEGGYYWYSDDGWVDSYYYDIGCPITFGLDAAFPISKRFNLGLYFSAGFDIPDLYVPIEVGPLFLFNFNKGSLYLGTGFHTDLGNFGGDIRLGYEFNCGVYLFYEVTLAGGDDHLAHGSVFHIGYNFLSRLGKKRK